MIVRFRYVPLFYETNVLAFNAVMMTNPVNLFV